MSFRACTLQKYFVLNFAFSGKGGVPFLPQSGHRAKTITNKEVIGFILYFPGGHSRKEITSQID